MENKKSPTRTFFILHRETILEAPPRFELGIKVLQTFALPLGYSADCVASEKSARNTGNHFNFAEKQRQDLQKINKLNGSFLPDETHRAAVPIAFEFEWVSPPPDNIAA